MASNKYDYKFITEPSERLKCLICFEVARDPKQHEDCGKMFCSECIEKNWNKPCPNCRAENPKYFKDRRGYQEIQDLHVKCDNVLRGCKWNGTVGTLDYHMATCKFAFISCPNKCKVALGKDLQLMRNDLDDHLKMQCPYRDCECIYCGEKSTYVSITKEHDKVCEKKIVLCPNLECATPMERCKTNEHVETVCEYGVVACKFKSIGCSVTKMRKDMKQHEENDDKVHLHLALDSIVTINKTVSLLEVKLATQKDRESMVFKFPGYSSKKKCDHFFCSEPFYTSPEGYKIRIGVYANGDGSAKDTHVSVYAEVLNGPYDDQLRWPFVGTVTVDLLNQLADDNHHRKQIHFFPSSNAQVGSRKGIVPFIPHPALSRDLANNTQYVMEDSLYFRVTAHLELDLYKPWLDCTMTKNSSLKKMLLDDKILKNGEALLFKLPGYSLRKVTNNAYYSEAFYTSPAGYKMCIKVMANGDGDGNGTHLSIYSKILEGPYDHKLNRPFMGTVTFEVLNQLRDANHHVLVLKYSKGNNGVVGSTRFISHSALSCNPTGNKQYLMEDTLYFRVTVKVDNHNRKPWLDCTCHIE